MNQSLAVTGEPGEEKAVQLPEAPLQKATTESALRARIVPTAPAETPDLAAPVTDSDGESLLSRAQAKVTTAQAKIATALSGPSIWHEPPKSLEGARGHHHIAAGHWEAALMRGPRLAWGYGVHLPAKAAGHLLDWLTESPVTTVAFCLIYTICHFWLLHWLPYWVPHL